MDIRKRQASPPEQAMNAKRRAQGLVAKRLQARARSPEDHHQIRVQSCCNCAKIFSTPHTLLSCTECDHTICTRCPVDDPLLLFPHPGLIQQRYEDMNKEDEHGNLGMGLSMFRRDQEHELGYDAEEEEHQQELQLQSQPQPTGEQRQVETGVPSKRSLNMNKCERCRLDKKKCLPTYRVWPTKCDLCIKKGFPCSESKRVVRSTKHGPALKPSPSNVISLPTTSVHFEELLKQWAFLLSYRKMIMAAKDELEMLEKYSTDPFLFPSYVISNIGPSSYSEFSRFAKHDLTNILCEYSNELLTQKSTSRDLPGWFLITHLDQYSFIENDNFACSLCSTDKLRPSPSGLGSLQDTCGELLLLQHRAIRHDDCSSGYWDAHVRLSHEVKKRASELFKSHGFYRSAKWAKSLGVYHPDQLHYNLPGPTRNFSDCLERSWLHLRMDDMDSFDDGDSFEPGLDVFELKDKQDLLGRTALIIACHEAWTGTVGWLLEGEADPGLATIYGSLPLHYAAAKGLINICKQLLAHKTRFDIRAKDCVGKTALDYAREKKLHDVVDLLSAEYAVVDQALEEVERARSLQTGIENHEVQGSYFV